MLELVSILSKGVLSPSLGVIEWAAEYLEFGVERGGKKIHLKGGSVLLLEGCE